jgi:hypothetical protein
MRRDVCWYTSPSAARILERLECKGPGTPEVVAADVHCSPTSARNLFWILQDAGVVHVCARIRQSRGLAKPVYALGPGVNVAPPKREPNAQRYRRRRAALISEFGVEVANKVLNAKAHGRPQVVVDGKRVRTGSVPYGVAGQVVRA